MLYGLLIGVGMILPGVSGGVIAVILGVYDKIIFAVNNIKKDKNELIFLIKIGIGLLIGIILSANLLKRFFDVYYIEMSYLFIGLILGTVPLLINEYKEKYNNQLNYLIIIIVMILSFVFSIIIKNHFIVTNDNKILLFISGIMFAIGKIVPGVSSSILLNLIGKYKLFLSIFSNPINYFLNNIMNSFIILLGLIIGLVISIKTISYLLKKYNSLTYSIIIGFVAGSISAMYPNTINFPGIMFLLIGLVISLLIPTIKK